MRVSGVLKENFVLVFCVRQKILFMGNWQVFVVGFIIISNKVSFTFSLHQHTHIHIHSVCVCVCICMVVEECMHDDYCNIG